jgi:hypothetical protein
LHDARRGDRLVAGSEDVQETVRTDGDLAFDAGEALGVAEMAVQRVAAAGSELDLEQRPGATRLGRRLEEGREVLLDRAVDLTRLDRDLHGWIIGAGRRAVVVRADDPGSSGRRIRPRRPAR